jgi:hypothetical protein
MPAHSCRVSCHSISFGIDKLALTQEINSHRMRDQILKLVHQTPFQPFSVDVASDVAYSIPTPDHVLAAKKVLVIEDDSGLVDVIPYPHIRRISFASSSQVGN